MKTLATETDETVKEYLRNNFLVCDTTSFLNKFLPVPETCIEEVFKKLCQESVYKNGRWARMPSSDGTGEDKHYKPFIDIANNISDAVKTSPVFPGQGQVNGVWVNRHSSLRLSKSSNEDAANTRPDCLYVTSGAVLEKLDKEIAHAREELDTVDTSVAAESGAAQVKFEEIEEMANSKLSVWWRQVHVPMEVKPKNREKDWRNACTQLRRHMHQVLSEQLDRRFLVGLALCFDRLTVLLSDRSGLFGTSKPIHIHEHPRHFIQVIASFGFLAPHRIGWDPAMEIHDPESNQPLPSYTVGIDNRIFDQSKYHTPWVIDIPSKDGKREKVVTVQTLSAARSEVMVGRAALVWEVVRYEERMNPTETFVLKRYWRPYRKPSNRVDIPSEADWYRIFDPAEDRVYSFEDITIDGKVDSTLEWIRQGLAYEPRTKKTRKTEWVPLLEDEVGAEPFLHLEMPPRERIVPTADPSTLVSRAHTQLVMPRSGWPIQHFSSLMELLQVFLAAVRDHHSFYTKGGVHGDISCGNIIIMPTDDSDGTTGRLIDFDHAKVSTELTTPIRPAPPPDHVVALMPLLSITMRSTPYTVESEILEKALQVLNPDSPSHALFYIRNAIDIRQQFFSLHPSGTVTSADLGWNNTDCQRPTFTSEARSHRTGTLSYMGVEVLTSNFHSRDFLTPNTPFFHDAVHDMESFLWVLVKLCLTRCGPGANMVRDQDNPYDRDLRDLVRQLFHSKKEFVLLKEKYALLQNPAEMQYVVDKFHPYFDELKPLVLQWWNILVLAYQFRAYEYFHIHSHVIDILEATIRRLEQIEVSPKDQEATQREIERRRISRRTVLNTFVPKDLMTTPRRSPVADIDTSLEHPRTTKHPAPDSLQRPVKKARLAS